MRFCLLYLCFSCLCILLVSGCRQSPQNGTLRGEVFVATRGGENIKLGLVPVMCYSLDVIKPYIDGKVRQANAELANLNPQVDAAKAKMDRTKSEWDRNRPFNDISADDRDYNKSVAAMDAYYALVRKRDQYYSGYFYFDNLPPPISITQSDADGKFSLQVPMRGQFVICAFSKRRVGDNTEEYYWMVANSLDGTPIKSILLANQNMTSSDSPDSLLKTSY